MTLYSARSTFMLTKVTKVNYIRCTMQHFLHYVQYLQSESVQFTTPIQQDMTNVTYIYSFYTCGTQK